MKHNFELYNKVSGEGAKDLYKQMRERNLMRKEMSNNRFKKFTYLFRGTAGIFIAAAVQVYTASFLWIMLFFLLTEGFLWCFKICWTDAYENILTDIGRIGKFQR